MEIRDDDLGLVQLRHQIGRDDIALAVVGLGIVGQKHPQPVADRDAGGDDQERVGEAAVLAVGQLVEGVPGDQHRHDHGLARAGRHLQGQAEQARVGEGVVLAQAVLDPGIAVLAGHFGDVDRRFQRLDLAEKKPQIAAGVCPVLQQTAGGGGNAQVAAPAPRGYPAPDAVDELVLLDAVLRPQVEGELLPLLLRLGDRDEILASPAAHDDLVGDALLGEAKMPLRFLKRGVDDRVFDDRRCHAGCPLFG